MPLIVIDELVRKIDKITDQSLLKNYPAIPWGEIKGMRNIVVHDYFNIDAEEIFNTCKEDIPNLLKSLILLFQISKKIQIHSDNKIFMIRSGMRNLLDKIPYSVLIIFTIMMLAAPIKPMPHVVEKILMLKNGMLNRPMDIFDLCFHLVPLILLILKWLKTNKI